jgi:peroxiredoxin
MQYVKGLSNIAVLSGLLALMFIGASVCCKKAESDKQAGAPASPDFLAQNKGRIVVALFGMEGCEETAKATKFLADFAKTVPQGVLVCRIDVPPPGEPIEKAENIAPSLIYALDENRAMASRLDFFFYPTLYVIDKDGAVRFEGECHPGKVKNMVSELVAETPGAEKKMFSLPLVKTGEIIPDFHVPGADGGETTLAKLCGTAGAILFFSTTTCPFSVKALEDLEKLKKDFKGRNFNYVIVSLGEDAAAAGSVYREKSPGSTVAIDADKLISSKHFGVTAVPFMYVLDKDRKVVERRPFVYETAKAAIAKAQGMKIPSGSGAAGAG